MARTVRFVVGHGCSIIRRGIKSLLQTRPSWVVCAEAATPNETLSLTVEHRPDIAIVTPKVSDFGSLGLHRFKGSVPVIEILIVSEHFSETFVHEVLKSGSRGFVSDSDPEVVFMAAVESLINHRPFLTPKAVQVILNSMPDMSGSSLASFRSNPLTAREREVAQLLAGGRRVKGIANELSLSHRTVDTHKTSIMRKLGLHSSVQLARFALRNQLISA